MIGRLELGQRADHAYSLEPRRRRVRGAASLEKLLNLGAATELAVAQRSYIDEVDARTPVAERRDEGREAWRQAQVDAIIGHCRALYERPRDPEVVRVAPDGEAAQLPHP